MTLQVPRWRHARFASSQFWDWKRGHFPMATNWAEIAARVREGDAIPNFLETAPELSGITCGAMSDAAASTTIGEAISSSHNRQLGTACRWGLGLAERRRWVLADGMCAVTQADAWEWVAWP